MDSLSSCLAVLFYMTLIINTVCTESTLMSNMCVTPTCVRAAADILEKMDSSVDPCDNFYKFTCGQFLNSTFTKPDEVMSNWQSDVHENIVAQLGSLLYSKISNNDIELFRQTKQLYRQCLDRSNIITQQDKNVLDIINKFGGWPVVMGDNWNATDKDWTKTSTIFGYVDYDSIGGYFLTLKLETSSKNSSIIFGKIQPMLKSNLVLHPVKNFANYTDDSAYYNFLMEYAVKLGAEKDRAKQELMEAIEFESNLLNISLAGLKEMKRNKLSPNNFMTIGEMMKKWPTIDWLTYINSIFSMSSSMEKINKNETVIVNCPTFITNFEKLMSSTPKRVLFNYAFAQIIVDLLELTNPGADIFLESEQLKMEDKNIWRDCVIYTVLKLPEIVTVLYIRNYIGDDAKLAVIDITSDIKMELIKTINEAKWFDVETRNNASNKILSSETRIGYPDLYFNDNEIAELFRDLELGESTYLHNLWKIYRLDVSFALRRMRNKNEFFKGWITILNSWFTLNAFYSASDNILVVSPDYLQRPAFDKKHPAYMNYGGIGRVIGHELVHAIDAFQKFVDEDRIMTDLLIKTSSENFSKRVNCFIDQYNNYTVEGTQMNLDGTLSHDENIADNVGVKISYFAYKNWLSQHEPELILPGLDYTPSQMFWINYASLECTSINPDYLVDTITTDSHALSEFRVLGALSNIPEFSEDFNCPLGSPMNPKIKCTIW